MTVSKASPRHVSAGFAISLANLFQHGETALHVAASVGHVDIVRYLWSKDIDIKATDKVYIGSCNLFLEN